MLVAVNRKNKELIPNSDKWVCDQGKLLLAIKKNPTIEVLIDRELPGALRVEDLIEIIKRKYPEVKISLIEKEAKVIIKTQSCLPYLVISLGTGGLILLLFFLLSKDFGGNPIFLKNLYISISIAMAVNFGITYGLSKAGEENKK